MIIDVHNHVGLSLDGGHGKLEELLSIMKELNISKSVVFATDEEDKGATYEKPNERILEIQKKHPGKIIAFTRIVPSAGKKAIDEFKRSCDNGAKGLKLKAIDGFHPDDCRPIFDLIKKKKEKFPVLMHTDHGRDSRPKDWEPLVKEYPEITFILAHGGKDHYRDCAQVALKYPNVAVDTSTLSLNRTRHIYSIAGASKLVFASDYPYSHQAIELAKYNVLIKDKKELSLVLYENAQKILGL